MTTSVPSKVLWGVQWEVFVVPAKFEAERPISPPAIDHDLTEEEQAAWDKFAQDNAAFEAEMVTAAGDEANWFKTVSTMDDEDSARETLAVLRDANQGNPFNRDFQLVTSQHPRWTVVPTDE